MNGCIRKQKTAKLIKEEKSKNHSITIKIQMDHKKFTYFTITEGKEI